MSKDNDENELQALKEKMKCQYRTLAAGTLEEKARRRYLEKLDKEEAAELAMHRAQLAERRRVQAEAERANEAKVEEEYRNILIREAEIHHKAELWAEWEASWEETRWRENDREERVPRELQERKMAEAERLKREEEERARVEKFRSSLRTDTSHAVEVEYARRCQFLEQEQRDIERCKALKKM